MDKAEYTIRESCRRMTRLRKILKVMIGKTNEAVNTLVDENAILKEKVVELEKELVHGEIQEN